MSRAKGEGGITQRKDGRWQASITDPATGKRVYVYARTQKEAAAKLAELRRQIAAGVRMGDARQTLAQYARHWLATRRANWKPRSYIFYEAQLRVNILPHLGALALNRITAQDIERWQADLVNISTARAQAALRVLRMVLHSAVQSDILTKNVATRVPSPRHEAQRGRVLSAQKEAALLAASPPHHQLAWRLALALGLRRGELAALHWSDLDFDAHTLTVRGGKTKAAARVLPLPAELAHDLHAHRQQQGSAGYVFGVGASSIGWWFRQDAQAAGLVGFTPHDLRHTCLTRLAERGVHPSVVQAIAGHASPEMALRVYTHVDLAAIRRAVFE